MADDRAASDEDESSVEEEELKDVPPVPKFQDTMLDLAGWWCHCIINDTKTHPKVVCKEFSECCDFLAPVEKHSPLGQRLHCVAVWQELLKTGGYNSVPMSGNAYSRQVLQQLFPIPNQYQLTADDYLKISVPFYGQVVQIAEPLGAYRIHHSNQWALTEVNGDRFRRFVKHDLQNYALLVQKAQELSLSALW